MSVLAFTAGAAGLAVVIGSAVFDRVPPEALRPERPDRRSGTRRSAPLPARRRVPPRHCRWWTWIRQARRRGRRRAPQAIRSPRTGRETARWATVADLRRLTVRPRGRRSSDRCGRLVLGRSGRRLISAEPAQSVIVFGPTQSLKTSGFAVPAILEWQGPVLATSIKADLIEHTLGHRRAVGSVACFDPSGTTGFASAGWSPLPAARTWPGARRTASALVEVVKASIGSMSDGDFWYATAAKMLAPLLFAAAAGGRSMDDVVRWVDTREEREVMGILELAGVDQAIHAAWSAFGKEERQRSSITTTLEMVLEPFAAGMASHVLDGRDREWIDPARLIEACNTLYLCAPAHDQRRLAPLFSAVVRSVLEHVYEEVSRTHRPLDPPLLVVLDEAANIAPLADLDGLASTAAGHGVQLVTIWHDLAQISARYGNRATTVVNNHRAKLFLSGISDPQTLEYASRMIGEEEVSSAATTAGGSGGPTTTRSPLLRTLIPPDGLRRIAAGEGVLVYGSLPPARLELRAWFDDPTLSHLAATEYLSATDDLAATDYLSARSDPVRSDQV
ncbi:MAG: type IV secretory system conjugative DNA transfer family protein [Acidimicrobiales bacterium]